MTGAVAAGRIGPNAILQPVALLDAQIGPWAAAAIAAAAMQSDRYVPPADLVDEHAVARLHALVRRSLGWDAGSALLAEAGVRTADYLLRHRIPRPVQWGLRALPRRWALAALAGAMARHAWTFAGSGRFVFHGGDAPVFEIDACPLCRGEAASAAACTYYTGVFERLLRVLVDREASVREVACQSLGDASCRFLVEWPG